MPVDRLVAHATLSIWSLPPKFSTKTRSSILQTVELLSSGKVVSSRSISCVQVSKPFHAVFCGNMPGLDVILEPELLAFGEVKHVIEGWTTSDVPMIAIKENIFNAFAAKGVLELFLVLLFEEVISCHFFSTEVDLSCIPSLVPPSAPED